MAEIERQQAMQSEEKQQGKIRQDWDPDRFPTSAKPVFRSTLLLVVIILGLCAVVYYSSDHPEEAERELKKLETEDQFLADEQFQLE